MSLSQDYLGKLASLQQDVVFIDAPWGGTDYKRAERMRLFLGDVSLGEIVQVCVRVARVRFAGLPLHNSGFVAVCSLPCGFSYDGSLTRGALCCAYCQRLHSLPVERRPRLTVLKLPINFDYDECARWLRPLQHAFWDPVKDEFESSALSAGAAGSGSATASGASGASGDSRVVAAGREFEVAPSKAGMGEHASGRGLWFIACSRS